METAYHACKEQIELVIWKCRYARSSYHSLEVVSVSDLHSVTLVCNCVFIINNLVSLWSAL